MTLNVPNFPLMKMMIDGCVCVVFGVTATAKGLSRRRSGQNIGPQHGRRRRRD